MGVVESVAKSRRLNSIPHSGSSERQKTALLPHLGIEKGGIMKVALHHFAERRFLQQPLLSLVFTNA